LVPFLRDGVELSQEQEKVMKRISRIAAVLVALALVAFLSVVPAFAAKPAPAGKININTASAEQLTALPGVGEKLAVRIVEYRQKAGSFRSTKELMNVQGIGEKNFAKLQAYLSVGERTDAKGDAAEGARGEGARADEPKAAKR
jgi:comEA protein